jgi:hypothetical protein
MGRKLMAALVVALVVGCSAGETSVERPAASEAEQTSLACSPDLTSDPRNCGACGRDCLGGACRASVCQPIQVAPIRGLIAADRWNLYAFQSNTLLKLDKAGADKPETLASDLPTFWSMAVDYASVYGAPVASPGMVFRVAKSGGPAYRLTSLSTPQSFGVTVGRDHVFFTTYDRRVMMVPKGMANAEPMMAVSLAPSGGPIHADGEFLYFAVDGVVKRTVESGFPAEQVEELHRGTEVTALAADADALYVLERRAALRRVPKDGSPVQTIAAPADPLDFNGYELVLDDDSVYWMSTLTHRVLRASKKGDTAYAAVVTVGELPSSSSNLAVDDLSIFWSDARGIWRLRK